MTGEIGVDVYINRATGYPARFVLTETVPDDEPRVWLLDILAIDEPVELDTPAHAADPAAVPTAPAFIGAPGS